MAKTKPTITAAARKAVEKVIGQQAEPHWDAKSHIAVLAYLSSLCGSPKEFAKELTANPFLLYASNTKKVLAELEIIPDTDTTAEYDFEE